MKHAFEVPRLLHDPGLASAKRYDAARLQCCGEERFPVSASLVLIDEADARVRRPLPLHGREALVQ
eukprot:1586387-Pleurochrysis_carterae.AAC.1